MLVLSRKTDESIWIDGDVEITALAVNGNRVKLGIGAPDSVRIVRTELLPTACQWDETLSRSTKQESRGRPKVRFTK
jgi:carbon storage regulator